MRIGKQAGRLIRVAGFAIVLVACLVAVGADESIGYRYESRLTKQQLNGARDRHVAAMLHGNRVGLFGGFSVSTVEIFDVASVRSVCWLSNRGLVIFRELP